MVCHTYSRKFIKFTKKSIRDIYVIKILLVCMNTVLV